MCDVSLAWLLHKPGVTSVMIGARTKDQITRNLKCIDLQLPENIIKELDKVTDDIKRGLGDNLDPYEGKEHSRIK